MRGGARLHVSVHSEAKLHKNHDIQCSRYKEIRISLRQRHKKRKEAWIGASFLFLISLKRACLTFRGARQILLTSCGPWHDVMQAHDDRSSTAFSGGNHACLHAFCCAAGMFFSLSYPIFYLYLLSLFPKAVQGMGTINPQSKRFRAAKLRILFETTKHSATFSFFFFSYQRQNSHADTTIPHSC
jgi:hypothetical protein